MKTVLVVYDSRSGHTARIARRIWETIIAEGHQADMMHVLEADREGVDWNKYDLVICSSSPSSTVGRPSSTPSPTASST